MVKLIRTLAPENGMHFDEICSFHTMNYIGIRNHAEDKFALVAKSDVEFHLVHLPTCTDLDELDSRVFAECDEHIIAVSHKSTYEIAVEDGADNVPKILEEQPVIDPESLRPQGTWIGEADGYADGELVYDVWYCSECNHCIDDGTDNPDLLPNYCPNCGADMREGQT